MIGITIQTTLYSICNGKDFTIAMVALVMLVFKLPYQSTFFETGS
jgi:hypothetical protein